MIVPTIRTAEVAERLNIAPRKVTKIAREIGVGHDYGGRVGFLFTEGDIHAIFDSLRVGAKAAS